MPADRTRISVRFAIIWRDSPSAIGLRQTFPVQTNKIFVSGLKARKGAMFAWAVQGSRIGVSAYRRIGVSAYRRIGVSAYRRIGVWGACGVSERGAWDALPRVRRCTSIEHATVKIGETNGRGPRLESACIARNSKLLRRALQRRTRGSASTASHAPIRRTPTRRYADTP